MARNSVEKRFCNACGADVRPQALFCYNCGSSVAPEIGGLEKPTRAEDAFLREEIGDETETQVKKRAKKNFDQPIEKPSGSPVEEKTPAQEKLKSAASLRKNARPAAAKKKTIEVVWETPDDAPNVWFLIVALGLTVFVGGILLAVLYFK